MRIFYNILYVLVFVIVFLSCENSKNNNSSQCIDKKTVSESLIEINKDLLMQESDMIDEYVKKNSLDVVKTGTGLRYQVFECGDGDYINKGDIVTLKYDLYLLNGELLYSSNNEGYKTFIVGRGGVESGLEEVILKLKKNSVSISIIPSYLAHGLIGDGNKIPPQAVIVYKLKVIDVKK